jgi:flagellar basal-body rod protein FlgF
MDITSALATSRLIAQQNAMDVTANNLANANTPGFRTERVQFSQWIDQQHGTQPGQGSQGVSYTQDRATWREMQAGTVTHTGNPYDLALSGVGRERTADPDPANGNQRHGRG